MSTFIVSPSGKKRAIDPLEESLLSTGSKIVTVLHSINNGISTNTDLEEKYQALVAQIDEINTSITDVNTNLTSVQDSVRQNEADIAILQSTTNGVQQSVVNLQNYVSAQQEQTGQSLSNFNASLIDIQSDVNEITTQYNSWPGGAWVSSTNNFANPVPLKYVSSMSGVTYANRFVQLYLPPNASMTVVISSSTTSDTLKFSCDNSNSDSVGFFKWNSLTDAFYKSNLTYNISFAPIYKGVPASTGRTWLNPTVVNP